MTPDALAQLLVGTIKRSLESPKQRIALPDPMTRAQALRTVGAVLDAILAARVAGFEDALAGANAFAFATLDLDAQAALRIAHQEMLIAWYREQVERLEDTFGPALTGLDSPPRDAGPVLH
jgi:hypothetical protein